MANQATVRGAIKTMKPVEGFGFVTEVATGRDYFFHRSAVEPALGWDHLTVGMGVDFEPAEGPKGPRALRVRSPLPKPAAGPVVPKEPPKPSKGRQMPNRNVAEMPGQKCLFRGKIPSPVSITLTPEHHVMVTANMARLGMTSRSDFIGLLIEEYADLVTF